MGIKEKNLINETLLNLPKNMRMFRTNSGMGWTGNIINKTKTSITIQNPRPFHGMPKGFPDLFGWECVEITPDMIGQKIAVATGYEVKATGKLRKCQENFKKMFESFGGVFKVIR